MRNCFFCKQPLTIGSANNTLDSDFEWCSNCSIEDSPSHWHRAWKSACFFSKRSKCWGTALKEINLFVLLGDSGTSIQPYNQDANSKSFNFTLDIDKLTPETLANKIKTWITFE